MRHDSTALTHGARRMLGDPGPTGLVAMTSDLATPLGQARANVATVRGRLVAAEAALERLYDAPFSDQERDRHEAEIADLTKRLAQRLAELNAIEAEQGLPLTGEHDGIDDPAPRRARLAALRNRRGR
jgi:small-conductance mechanosensitive channel